MQRSSNVQQLMCFAPNMIFLMLLAIKTKNSQPLLTGPFL